MINKNNQKGAIRDISLNVSDVTRVPFSNSRIRS